MKNITIITALAALFIVGCGNKEEAVATGGSPKPITASVAAMGYEPGSKKVGDMGACAVCTINEGKVSAEEVSKAVLDYEGKTYVFCDDAEKAVFISDPKKFAAGK